MNPEETQEYLRSKEGIDLPTRKQVVNLRDLCLQIGLKSSAAAIDNALDVLHEELWGDEADRLAADAKDQRDTLEDARQVGLQ